MSWLWERSALLRVGNSRMSQEQLWWQTCRKCNSHKPFTLKLPLKVCMSVTPNTLQKKISTNQRAEISQTARAKPVKMAWSYQKHTRKSWTKWSFSKRAGGKKPFRAPALLRVHKVMETPLQFSLPFFFLCKKGMRAWNKNKISWKNLIHLYPGFDRAGHFSPVSQLQTFKAVSPPPRSRETCWRAFPRVLCRPLAAAARLAALSRRLGGGGGRGGRERGKRQTAIAESAGPARAALFASGDTYRDLHRLGNAFPRLL